MRALTATTAAALLALGLAACSGSATETRSTTHSMTAMSPSTSGATSQAMMHDMDGGPAPAGMKPAAHPKYPVGTQVTLTADHMPGMKGAKATVRGVYATTTYAVDYTPTTGGAMVKDHKWVVQEELAGAGAKRVADGAPVTITADHMPGMKGAKGTVVSSTDQPVYIVDYDMDGMLMRNHKWVVEDEIKPLG